MLWCRVKGRERQLLGKGIAARQASAERHHALEHDPEKWKPVFRKRSCSNKKITLEHDSTQLNHALRRNDHLADRPERDAGEFHVVPGEGHPDNSYHPHPLPDHTT